MNAPLHPWRHHNEGARHFAMCSYGCGVLAEWRATWGSTDGIPSAAQAKVAKHVATCERRAA